MRAFAAAFLLALVALPAAARDVPLSKEDVAWLDRVTFGVDSATVARYRELGRRRFLDEQLHPKGDGLPADVRAAVLAKCGAHPDAGHYFATYFHDEVHLHYEHLHCSGASYCNASGCLHQTYKLSGGHYHLTKTFYGARND